MSAEAHIEQVLKTVDSPKAAAQSRVAASWWRSHFHHGLDPATRRTPEALTQTEFVDHIGRADKLLHVAGQRLDHLFGLVGASGCSVILTETDGVVIDQRCGSGDKNTFEGWGLRVGTDWSEAREGTNGIGTCLAEQRSVVIHRNQHFLARNIGLSCICAPVFGAEGNLVGALDISSARGDQTVSLNRMFAEMAVQIASQVEADLLRLEYPAARIVVVNGVGSDSVALLAVDNDDLVVGANREARKLYNLPIGERMRAVPSSDLLGLNGPATGFQNAERRAVVRALARSGGNMSAAARSLGISRATLYRHIKRLGIQPGTDVPLQSD
jgi:transcriptional regulator of acetoin/glycerol metabolism